MTILHHVRLRAYSHATEDLSRVESAVRFASGVRKVETEPLKGHHGNPVVKVTAFLSKKDHISAFLERLARAGVFPGILGTLDRRVDQDGSLHIRLSKQAAFKGRIEMTDGDDAISISAKVKAYPARRETVLEVLAEALQE